jgi:hypothetical protein
MVAPLGHLPHVLGAGGGQKLAQLGKGAAVVLIVGPGARLRSREYSDKECLFPLLSFIVVQGKLSPPRSGELEIVPAISLLALGCEGNGE